MKVKTEFTAYQGMPYWQQEKTKIEQYFKYVFCVSKIWEVKISIISVKDRSPLLLWWVAKLSILVIPWSQSAPNVQLQQTKIPPVWNMISSAVVAVEVFIKNAHVPTFTQPPTSELDVNKLCDSHM